MGIEGLTKITGTGTISSDTPKTKEINETELVWKALKIAPNSDVGVYLYQLKVNNDEILNQIDAGEKILNTVRPLIRISRGYVYLDVEFPDDNDLDIKSTARLYERYLDENTKYFEREDIEFLLCITLTGLDEETGLIYTTEFINPLFMSHENNILRFVTESDSVQVHRMEMDYDKFNAEQEVDYEMATEGTTENLRDVINRGYQEEMEDEMENELYSDTEDDEEYDDDEDDDELE